VGGCVECRRDEIGGKGRAGFAVGVLAVTEKGERADDRNERGGVRKRREEKERKQ
jgi:hypothetical protein